MLLSLLTKKSPVEKSSITECIVTVKNPMFLCASQIWSFCSKPHLQTLQSVAVKHSIDDLTLRAKFLIHNMTNSKKNPLVCAWLNYCSAPIETLRLIHCHVALSLPNPVKCLYSRLSKFNANLLTLLFHFADPMTNSLTTTYTASEI